MHVLFLSQEFSHSLGREEPDATPALAEIAVICGIWSGEPSTTHRMVFYRSGCVSTRS